MKRILLILLATLILCDQAYSGIQDDSILWIVGGSDLTDQSASGYDGSEVNGPLTQATGPFGGTNTASTLDGIDQYITVSSAPLLSEATGSFSIAGWVYLDTLTVNSTILTLGTSGAATAKSLYVGSDGYAKLFVTQAFINYRTHVGDETVPTGQWVSIVATRDGTTGIVKIYTDAVENTVTGTVDSAAITDFNDDVLSVGKNSGSTFYFDGSVNAVSFWDRVLSQAEVTEYNAGPPATISITNVVDNQKFQRDASTNSKDITINFTYEGEPTAIEASFDGGAYSTVDASPTGGSGSGVLTCASGDGDLVIRFTNATGTTDTITGVGVGEVLAIWGQSNAAGQTTNIQTYTGTQPAFQWNGSAWITYVSDRSIWPIVMNNISSAEACPIYVFKSAVGATTLSTSPFEWAKGGIYYNLATSYLTTSGVDGGRICWWQGETDAANGTTETAYEAAEELMLSDARTDTGLSGLTLHSIQLGPVGSQTTTLNNVRLAKSDNWDDIAGIYCGGVLSDIQLVNRATDNVHFQTDAEAAVAAERFYYFLGISAYGNSGGRGPRFSSVAKEGTNQLRVTFTVANGTLQGAATTGWREADDTNAAYDLSVTTAVIENGNEVLLTFDGVIGESPILSYSWGEDAETSLLRDTSSVPGLVPANTGLPPEPFIDQPAYAVTTVTFTITGTVAGRAIINSVEYGDGEATTVTPGTVNITWLDVFGYYTPDPQTFTATEGNDYPITGAYIAVGDCSGGGSSGFGGSPWGS